MTLSKAKKVAIAGLSVLTITLFQAYQTHKDDIDQSESKRTHIYLTAGYEKMYREVIEYAMKYDEIPRQMSIADISYANEIRRKDIRMKRNLGPNFVLTLTPIELEALHSHYKSREINNNE